MMIVLIIKILPYLLLIVLGNVLKRTAILKSNDGNTFLKLVFYITLPALILKTIGSVEVTREFAFLPFVSVTVILFTYFMARVFAWFLNLSGPTKGTFLTGSMILNIGFTLPFVLAAFGDEGLSRIFIMDMGNGIMVFTFVYYQACRYNKNGGLKQSMVFRIFKAPPIWAIPTALVINFSGVELNGLPLVFLKTTGDLTIPLLMISVGLFFNPKIVQVKALFSVLLIRMGFGLVLGVFISWLLNLDGLTKMIIILGAATPVGYNTLTFSAIENLDREFASSLVSISVLIGVFYLPLLIWLFG
ncbi:MAG: AEC family transporter [Bacteroidales bacterium]|nr:AEC family transporter [Bacteroidales bacterium]